MLEETFRRLVAQFMGGVRLATARIARAALLGLALGLALMEGLGWLVDGRWPTRPFVHLAALALALTLGYALAATMAIYEGLRGMVKAANRMDDMVERVTRTATSSLGGFDQRERVVDAEHPHARP